MDVQSQKEHCCCGGVSQRRVITYPGCPCEYAWSTGYLIGITVFFNCQDQAVVAYAIVSMLQFRVVALQL